MSANSSGRQRAADLRIAALLAVALASLSVLAESPRKPLAQGVGTAQAPVGGPISLRLHVGSASVQVAPSDGSSISVTVANRPALRIALFAAGGDRVEVEFDGRRRLSQGALVVRVPKGSRLDLGSLDGAIVVRGAFAEVRVRGMSGEVDVASAARADIETIDGEISVVDTAGPVAIRTISGNVSVVTTAPGATLEIETADGNINWRGACGQGCHADVDTVSGQVHFALDRKSAFELRLMTHSGRLKDSLGLAANKPPPDAGETGWRAATYGSGSGEVECETFSGDVTLSEH